MKVKRLLSSIIALAMLLCSVGVPAFAAEAATTVSTEAELTAAIASGGDITLGANIDLTGAITIPAGVTVSIDLGGFTLSTESLDKVNPIINNGNLTLTNGNIVSSRNGVANESTGTLNISKVNITATKTYEDYDENGELYTYGYQGIWNGGTLTASDCNITGANNGIYNSEGTVTITGGTYTGILYNGVSNWCGNVTITGGTFTTTDGNNSLYNMDGTVTVKDGSFPNGAYNYRESSETTLLIEGGTFGGDYNGNYSVSNDDGTTTITGGSFTGVIGNFDYGNSVFKISGGTFENTIQDDDAILEITGGKFAYKPKFNPENTLNAFVKNADGYYEYKTGLTAVVSVTVNGVSTEYADADRAVEAAFAEANSNIVLLADATLEVRKTLKTTASIDLNGHNLNCNMVSGPMITSSGALTVTDSTVTPGTVYLNSTDTSNGAYFVKVTQGSVTTENVNYVCSFATPSFSYVFDAAGADASVTINSGNFTVQKGVIKQSNTSSTVVINGGTFLKTDGTASDVIGFLAADKAQNPNTGTVQAKSGTTYSLTVTFPEPYTVTVNGNSYTSGNQIEVDEFDKVTVALQSGENSYYKFTGWTVTGTETTTETASPLTLTMTEDKTVTATMPTYETTEITADADGVYNVTTPQELNYLAYISYFNKESFAGKTIKIANALDFTGIAYFPIGRSNTASFAGTFDGNGMTISNMNVTAPDYCGVIGQTANGAVIKNLTVQNSTFAPAYVYDTNRTYAGAIVGAATGAEITNCSSIGNKCDAWFSGAIAGHGYPIKLISGCTVEGATVSGTKNGGIVGFVGSSGTFTDITVKNSTVEGGSIIGNVNEANSTITITNAVVENTKDSGGDVSPVINTSESSTAAPEIEIGGTETNITASAIGNVPTESVTITGGTFSNGVDGTSLDISAYIADGTKTVTDTTTGDVTVVTITETEGAASIVRSGSTLYFETLQAALDAAQDGETVTLLKSVTGDGVVFNRSVTATLDLGGFTLKATSNGNNTNHRVIYVTAGNLTVQNGTLDARMGEEGAFASTTGADTDIYGTVRAKDAVVTLKNLTLYNNHNWGMSIKADSGSDITVENCTVNSYVGGGLESAGGKITVKDSTFTQTGSNTSYPYIASGLAVSYGGAVDIYNSGFKTSGDYALYVYSSGGTINAYSGVFKGAKNSIHVDTSTTATVDSVVNVYGGSYYGSIATGGTSDTYINDVNVYAGSFDAVVPAEFCAEGYVPVTVADATTGLYTVVADTFVASVTSADGTTVTKYDTLQAAFDEAEASSTVTLLRDISDVTAINNITKNITFDLAGHKLEGSVSGLPLVSCDYSTEVTITDTGTTKGKISNTSKTGTVYGVRSYGTKLTIDGVVIEVETSYSQKIAGAVYLPNAKTSATVKNSTLSAKSVYTAKGIIAGAKSGQSINVSDSTINVTGGSYNVFAVDLGKYAGGTVTNTVISMDISNSTTATTNMHAIERSSANAEEFTMSGCSITMTAPESNNTTAYIIYNQNTSSWLSIADGTYVVKGAAPALKNVSVSGGLYSFRVADECCAAGKVCTEAPNTDGYYEIIDLQETDAAVQVTVDGQTEPIYYANLSAAVNSHTNDTCIITLLKNDTVSTAISCGANTTLIINEGVTLDCQSIVIAHGTNNGTINAKAVTLADFTNNSTINAAGVVTLTNFTNNGAFSNNYTGTSTVKITVNEGVVNNGTISGATNVSMDVVSDMTGTNAMKADIYKWLDNAWVVAESAVEIIRNGEHLRYCESIKDALNYAENGDVIKLYDNLSAVRLDVTKSVTLDLNGCTVTGTTNTTTTGTGLAFTVKTGATFTVMDSKAEATGETPVMDANGNITYNAGKITANGLYQTIDVQSGGKLVLQSGMIENTYAKKSCAAIWLADSTTAGVSNAEFEMTGGAVAATGTYGDAIAVFGTGSAETELDSATAARVKISGGVVSAKVRAIVGNGTYHNTDITISGGELYSPLLAIYHPQNGKLTITGGTITGGVTGVEIRAGELTMTGGEVIGNADGAYTAVETNPNGSGATTFGAGIGVSQHTTKLPLTINISENAVVEGAAAVYESNPQGNSAEDIAKVSVAITGGTFTGTSTTQGAIYSEDCTEFVSGGSFSSEVTESYCVTGLTTVYDETAGTYSVVADTFVASVTSADGTTVKKYETVDAAVAAAAAGETVTLLKDVTGVTATITIDKNITLDLAGHTLEGSVKSTGIVKCAAGTDVSIISRSDAKGKISNSVDGVAYAIYSNADKVTVENLEIVAESTSKSTAYALNIVGSKASNKGDVSVDNCVISATTEGSAVGVNMTSYSTAATISNSTINVKNGTNLAYAINLSSSYSSAAITNTAMNVTIESGTCSKMYAINRDKSNANNLDISGCSITMTAQDNSTTAYPINNQNTSSPISITDGTYIVNNATPALGNVQVSGGQFNFQLLEAYCADGYVPTTEPVDGMYTVEAAPAASVTKADGTTVEYDTLQEAIAAAQTGETVTLLRDVALDYNYFDLTSTDMVPLMTITSDITLDLAGHKISWDLSDMAGYECYFLFFSIDSANVTIKDSSAAGTGMIDAEAKYNNSFGIDIVNGGSLTIESGTFTGATTAVQVTSGSLSITGGTFDQAATIKEADKLYGLGFAKYVVNAIDSAYKAGTAEIAISGGTFCYDYSNYPEGAGSSYFADGYAPEEVVIDGVTYYKTVVAPVASVTSADGTVTNYYTLSEAVAAALENGGEVKLLTNFTGGGIKVPSGSNLTVDFGGFTYTVTDPTVGSTGTETNGFQLLRDSNITFKNGTIKADANATSLKIMIQNYSNLTLENITIDGSANSKVQYVVSNNYGNTVMKGDTNITAPEGAVAFDVYYWPNGGYDSVSVTLDETMTGTITGKVEYGDDNTTSAAVVAENAKLVIKSGTVNGEFAPYGLAAADPGIEISGGSFSSVVKDEYCAEGFVPVTEADATTGLYTVKVDTSVASVTSADGTVTKYDTLQAAINAAQTGETVTVLKDIESADYVVVSNSIILELNGHTVSSSNIYATILTLGGDLTVKDSSEAQTGKIYNSADKGYAVWVYSGGKLTLTSGSIEAAAGECVVLGTSASTSGSMVMDGGSVKGTYGILVYGNSSLTVNSGSIEGTTNAGIVGHGSDNDGTTITVTGGTVTGVTNGIYHPQDGVLTVTGGTITGGSTGIEMRAGTLKVTGGTVTGNADGTYSEVTVVANGSGSTTAGAGIAVAQHTTKKAISVSISGTAVVSGAAAVYESDPQGNNPTNITLNISGGTFTGTGTDKTALYSADCTGFVSGGSFSSVVDASYCAAGFVPVQYADSDGMYTVKPEENRYIVTIDGVTYLAEMNGSFTREAKEGVVAYSETYQSGETVLYPTQEDGTLTLSVDHDMTLEPQTLGVELSPGAQVRVGQGVDANNKIITTDAGTTTDTALATSGLRFIGLIDLSAQAIAKYGVPEVAQTANLANGVSVETGIEIAPSDSSENKVQIKAEKFQNDYGVFSAALVNLSESNYNRLFTAKPYVKLTIYGKDYIYYGEPITRSIYEVAAGVLVDMAVEGEADVDFNEASDVVQKVLNAYVNQVGIRLNFANEMFTPRTSGKGAYQGGKDVGPTVFFEVTSTTQNDDGTYTVEITALSNAQIFDYWKDYIRMNNAMLKDYIVSDSLNGNTLTLTISKTKKSQ